MKRIKDKEGVVFVIVPDPNITMELRSSPHNLFVKSIIESELKTNKVIPENNKIGYSGDIESVSYFISTIVKSYLDIYLIDNTTIKECMSIIQKQSLELLTCKFRCEGRYSFVFPIFEFFRDLSIRYSPCAIGGFMLFEYDSFIRVGGFDDEDKFAEDFHLSSKIPSESFKVINKKIYTTDRRFQKKGLFYMVRVAILSIMNKNNPAFFKYDHNYWL